MPAYNAVFPIAIQCQTVMEQSSDSTVGVVGVDSELGHYNSPSHDLPVSRSILLIICFQPCNTNAHISRRRIFGSQPAECGVAQQVAQNFTFQTRLHWDPA